MYDSEKYFASIVLDDNGRSCCVTCRELLHIDGAGRTIAHSHAPRGTDRESLIDFAQWLSEQVELDVMTPDEAVDIYLSRDVPLREPQTSSVEDALAIVREWVEKEVDDYRDPVIDPGLHDTLRIVVGLPPYSRDD